MKLNWEDFYPDFFIISKFVIILCCSVGVFAIRLNLNAFEISHSFVCSCIQFMPQIKMLLWSFWNN